MNVSGVIRGYMSKNMGNEKFLLTVAQTIENQLNEWDPNYEMNVLKLENYELWIKHHGEHVYDLTISEQEVHLLQHQSPFSLDIALWKQLEEQCMDIKQGYGNYIDMIRK